jgi:hypothetical protein
MGEGLGVRVFHVPLAFLTTQTNLANLQAAESQHMSKAINPRLQLRDEMLNEQLIPIYDPTRRLDPEATWQTMKINIQFGIVTINEARDAQGLTPVPWGDKPWLPDNQAQANVKTMMLGYRCNQITNRSAFVS